MMTKLQAEETILMINCNLASSGAMSKEESANFFRGLEQDAEIVRNFERPESRSEMALKLGIMGIGVKYVSDEHGRCPVRDEG